MKKTRKFEIDRRQKVKGQHKGQTKFCIFIPQNFKNGLKASELNKIEVFSKGGCCCGCGYGGLNEVV